MYTHLIFTDVLHFRTWCVGLVWFGLVWSGPLQLQVAVKMAEAAVRDDTLSSVDVSVKCAKAAMLAAADKAISLAHRDRGSRASQWSQPTAQSGSAANIPAVVGLWNTAMGSPRPPGSTFFHGNGSLESRPPRMKFD